MGGASRADLSAEPVDSAGRFSTVGLRAAVAELEENGPDIGWQFDTLLGEEAEEIDDSKNNGTTHRGDSVGFSSVGSLGHTLAE